MPQQVLKTDIEHYARHLLGHRMMGRIRAGQFGPADLARFLNGVLFMIEHVQVHPHRASDAALRAGDPALADYYQRKFQEENGHEAWVRRDLATVEERFGVSAAGDAPQSTAELMRFIGDAIDRNPKSYLAYILFLEYLTVLVGPALLRGLEERCAIPPSAVSVVARHVTLDQDHVVEGFEEIARLTTAADLPMMRETLHAAMNGYEKFWDEIEARAA